MLSWQATQLFSPPLVNLWKGMSNEWTLPARCSHSFTIVVRLSVSFHLLFLGVFPPSLFFSSPLFPSNSLCLNASEMILDESGKSDFNSVTSFFFQTFFNSIHSQNLKTQWLLWLLWSPDFFLSPSVYSDVVIRQMQSRHFHHYTYCSSNTMCSNASSDSDFFYHDHLSRIFCHFQQNKCKATRYSHKPQQTSVTGVIWEMLNETWQTLDQLLISI